MVGAEVFWDILCNASIDLGKTRPKINASKLRWIVSDYLALPSHIAPLYYCNVSINELNANINEFWELDSVSSKKNLNSLSKENNITKTVFV